MVAFDAGLGTKGQNTSATTIAITTTAAAAAASTIFVCGNYDDAVGGKAGTCASSPALTWTTVPGSDTRNAGTDCLAWYVAQAPAGLALGSTITITYSSTPSVGTGLAAAVSFTGIKNVANPVERVATAQTTATAWTISPTVDSAGDLALAGSFDHASSVDANTPNIGTEAGAEIQNTGLPGALVIEYVIAGSAGATTVSGAWSVASTQPLQVALAVAQGAAAGVPRAFNAIPFTAPQGRTF